MEHGGSLAIKSFGKEQQMTLHLKKRMVEENPTALRLPGGVLGGLHVGQLDEHLVQHQDGEKKLDPVGSTVRYEMMKLCTGSV